MYGGWGLGGGGVDFNKVYGYMVKGRYWIRLERGHK